MSEGRKYYCLCESNCKFETLTKEQIYALIAQAAESGLVFDADAAFITKIKEENTGDFVRFWVGTQEQWNKAPSPNPFCFPIFTDDADFPTMAQAVAAAVNHLKATNNPHNVTWEQVGAAPSGYGLGELNARVPYNGDINNARESGIYTADGSPSDSLPLEQGFKAALMLAENQENATQLVFGHSELRGGHYLAIRDGNCKGDWKPWQWIIPPMMGEEEYLTAENYSMKPVYIKRVDCGYMPGTDDVNDVGFKTIEVCSEDATFISYDIYVRNEEETNLIKLPYYLDGNLAAEAKIINGNISIVSYRDVSHLTCFAVVKYIKN